MKCYKLFLLSTCCLFLFEQCSTPKQTQSTDYTPLQSVGFAVSEGQLMVFNTQDAYYTFLIKGEEIHNTKSGTAGDPMAFIVDGVFLQVTTLPIYDFYKEDLTGLDDLALLAAHQLYETAQMNSSLEQEYKIYREPVTLNNGRQCLVWMMEVEGLPTQILITTVVRPHILLLSSALFDGGKIEEDRVVGKLIGAIESINQRSEPINIRELQDSLIKVNIETKSASSG